MATTGSGERLGQPSRNLLAVALMLVTASVWASVPLAVDLTDGAQNAFLFNAGWRAGGCVGCLAVLVFRFPKLLSDMVTDGESEARKLARSSFSFRFRNLSWRNRHFGGWSILYGCFGKFSYAFFALAAGFASVATVAVIYEIWPVVMVVCMAWLFRGSPQYRPASGWLILMVVASFIGFVLVAWPERSILPGSVLIVGVGVAVLGAAIAGSQNAVAFRWADILGRDLHQAGSYGRSLPSLLVFGSVFAQCITQLMCVVISIPIVLMTGGEINYSLVAVAVAGGLLSSGLADVLFRAANTIGDNLGVNAISYTTPLFALGWLSLFSTVEVAKPDFLIIGAMIVVMSNLLINFEAEIRWGFKSLILALGMFGMVAYLRDGLFDFLEVADWYWPAGGYFEAVALSATVFTLLLAFRVARLVTRTNAEEYRTFVVFRKLDLLVRRGVISDRVREYVMRVGDSQDQGEIREAYTRARVEIAGICPSNEADRQRLNEVEVELDTLVRSKQLGLVLGELFALVIFAGITVSLAMFSRPDASGWTRLLADLFAMLISSVIVFLTVNVWDLHRERGTAKLELVIQYGDYMVRFPDTQRRSTDQLLSVVVGVVIVATYTGLFGHKWLGWFS